MLRPGGLTDRERPRQAPLAEGHRYRAGRGERHDVGHHRLRRPARLDDGQVASMGTAAEQLFPLYAPSG
ncbi:hypothetical protein [Nonomuraea sp. NPDC049709]|uniref:hypothetical protein n=1 Tax=Nonomuraea sp. NPDC049709 TaxID=3154736 RepID=UPI0034210912